MDKIICVGKNYLDHAKELGGTVPTKPLLFLKPGSVLRTAGQGDEPVVLKLPSNRGEVHHEAEIVLRLDKGGSHLEPKEAEKLIGAVTVGLDMTLRTVQEELKKNGHPWTVSKVFQDAAVIGPWLRASEFQNFLEEKFSFALDGQLKQQGFGKDMLFSPAECISYISKHFPLVAGDLIFTGTPAGVGCVKPGQKGTLVWGQINYSVKWE